MLAGGGSYFYDFSRGATRKARSGAQDTDVAGHVVGPAATPPAEAEQTAPPSAPAVPPRLGAVAGCARVPTLTLAAVTPVLASVPCSALVASVHDQTVDVQGYVSERYGTARLKQVLSARARREDDEPRCAAGRRRQMRCAQGIWSVLDDRIVNGQARFAAYARAEGAADRGRSADRRRDDARLRFLCQRRLLPARRHVVHLVPSPRAKDNQAPPHYSATIGTRATGWSRSRSARN